MNNVSWIDRPSADDLRALNEIDRQASVSYSLGEKVCLSLALGLLPEGVRRFGRWAHQLRLWRVSVLFVILNQDDLRQRIEYEKCAESHPPHVVRAEIWPTA